MSIHIIAIIFTLSIEADVSYFKVDVGLIQVQYIDSEYLTNNNDIWTGIATHNTCPHFGNEFHPGSYSFHDGLFLNVKSPSQCYGNVTEWKFCYTSGRTSQTYEVQFMLFRQKW